MKKMLRRCLVSSSSKEFQTLNLKLSLILFEMIGQALLFVGAKGINQLRNLYL